MVNHSPHSPSGDTSIEYFITKQCAEPMATFYKTKKQTKTTLRETVQRTI